MRFAKFVFIGAGLWGFLVLAPFIWLHDISGRAYPPPTEYPHFFWGFFAITTAWQLAFLIIARDPQRFRPIIPAAILEKLVYVVACVVLLAGGRIPPIVALGGAGDFILGTLFTISYFRLKNDAAAN